MKDINIREQLNRISDELIDNMLNTPDAEILKEVEEEYGDPDYLANKVRGIIEKVKSNIQEGKG